MQQVLNGAQSASDAYLGLEPWVIIDGLHCPPHHQALVHTAVSCRLSGEGLKLVIIPTGLS